MLAATSSKLSWREHPVSKADDKTTARTTKKYTIDDDSVNLSHVRTKTSYLQSVANGLKLSHESASGETASEKQVLLNHLKDHHKIEPKEDWDTKQIPLEVRRAVKGAMRRARIRNAAKKPRLPVTLEKITDQESGRQDELYAALAKMRDKQAWLWPHSPLNGFVARPEEPKNPENPNSATPLKEARRASRTTWLHDGEKRFAVDPTTYEIVKLGRFEKIPQLDNKEAMRKHIEYHQNQKNRVFYAINAEVSHKFVQAWKKTRTTGFIFLGPEENRTREIQIFVKSRYRKNGIATGALGEIVKTVKEHYPDTTTLEYLSEAMNLGSRGAARKSGFKLQEVTIDDVDSKWQLVRERENPTEVNAQYTISGLNSDSVPIFRSAAIQPPRGPC